MGPDYQLELTDLQLISRCNAWCFQRHNFVGR